MNEGLKITIVSTNEEWVKDEIAKRSVDPSFDADRFIEKNLRIDMKESSAAAKELN